MGDFLIFCISLLHPASPSSSFYIIFSSTLHQSFPFILQSSLHSATKAHHSITKASPFSNQNFFNSASKDSTLHQKNSRCNLANNRNTSQKQPKNPRTKRRTQASLQSSRSARRRRRDSHLSRLQSSKSFDSYRHHFSSICAFDRRASGIFEAYKLWINDGKTPTTNSPRCCDLIISVDVATPDW